MYCFYKNVITQKNSKLKYNVRIKNKFKTEKVAFEDMTYVSTICFHKK